MLFYLTTGQLLEKGGGKRQALNKMYFWSGFKFVPLLGEGKFKNGQMPNWKGVKAKSESGTRLRKNLTCTLCSLAQKPVLCCIS